MAFPEVGPTTGSLGELGDPFIPPVFGAGAPAWSGRCVSVISLSLRLKFCIIVAAGLMPGLTRSFCELADDSGAEPKAPGNLGDVGCGCRVGGGVIGLVEELGIGGGGPTGFDMSAVFSAVTLAASSAACLSAFCCLKILSTKRKMC